MVPILSKAFFCVSGGYVADKYILKAILKMATHSMTDEPRRLCADHSLTMKPGETALLDSDNCVECAKEE